MSIKPDIYNEDGCFNESFLKMDLPRMLAALWESKKAYVEDVVEAVTGIIDIKIEEAAVCAPKRREYLLGMLDKENRKLQRGLEEIAKR